MLDYNCCNIFGQQFYFCTYIHTETRKSRLYVSNLTFGPVLDVDALKAKPSRQRAVTYINYGTRTNASSFQELLLTYTK